jgi:hypothetical protein
MLPLDGGYGFAQSVKSFGRGESRPTAKTDEREEIRSARHEVTPVVGHGQHPDTTRIGGSRFTWNGF